MKEGSVRDPASTRQRILDAAAEAFAARGFAGARVDRIAAAAGVNKRMLYHYFGDKQGLHRAVLADRIPPPASGAAPAPLTPLAARLWLWSLLEPETAAEARRHWHLDQRLGSGTQAQVLLASVLTVLAGPAAGSRKPRIRLSHRAP